MKKHKLQNTFEDKFCVLLERASRDNGESSQFWSDAIIDFFWNEIEQIRKEDMERVEKEVITLPCICHKCEKTGVNPFGECRCSYEDNKYISKKQVLSIIKQPKGSFAVWSPEIKEHANQVKEIIENREKHETIS